MGIDIEDVSHAVNAKSNTFELDGQVLSSNGTAVAKQVAASLLPTHRFIDGFCHTYAPSRRPGASLTHEDLGVMPRPNVWSPLSTDQGNADFDLAVGAQLEKRQAFVAEKITELGQDDAPKSGLALHDYYGELVAKVEKQGPIRKRVRSHLTAQPGELPHDDFKIPGLNGIITLKTDGGFTVTPHEPVHLYTAQTNLVTNFDDDHAENVRKRLNLFLEEAHPDCEDTRNVIRRIMALGLVGGTQGNIVNPFFRGSGANGKSTLLEGMRKLLGRGYSVKIDPQMALHPRQSDYKLARATMKGARWGITDEIEEGLEVAGANLKSFTEEETVAREHYRQFADVRIEALLILQANNDIRLTDMSHGLWRRMMYIAWRVQFDKDLRMDKDPILSYVPDAKMTKLVKYMSSHAAAPGFTKWLLLDCWPLLCENRMDIGTSERIIEDTEAFKGRSSQGTPLAFMEEYTEPCNDTDLLEAVAYAAYHSWIRSQGRPPRGDQRFKAQLENSEFSNEHWSKIKLKGRDSERDRNRFHSGLYLKNRRLTRDGERHFLSSQEQINSVGKAYRYNSRFPEENALAVFHAMGK